MNKRYYLITVSLSQLISRHEICVIKMSQPIFTDKLGLVKTNLPTFIIIYFMFRL